MAGLSYAVLLMHSSSHYFSYLFLHGNTGMAKTDPGPFCEYFCKLTRMCKVLKVLPSKCQNHMWVRELGVWEWWGADPGSEISRKSQNWIQTAWCDGELCGGSWCGVNESLAIHGFIQEYIFGKTTSLNSFKHEPLLSPVELGVLQLPLLNWTGLQMGSNCS